jgi:pre-mRNA-splicing factor 38B
MILKIIYRYEDYLEDEEEIDVKAGGGQTMTIGQMVRQWLTKLDWFSTLFPRIPVPIQKQIEQKLGEYDREHNTGEAYAAVPTTSRTENWGERERASPKDYYRERGGDDYYRPATTSRSDGWGEREDFDRSGREDYNRRRYREEDERRAYKNEEEGKSYGEDYCSERRSHKKSKKKSKSSDRSRSRSRSREKHKKEKRRRSRSKERSHKDKDRRKY